MWKTFRKYFYFPLHSQHALCWKSGACKSFLSIRKILMAPLWQNIFLLVNQFVKVQFHTAFFDVCSCRPCPSGPGSIFDNIFHFRWNSQFNSLSFPPHAVSMLAAFIAVKGNLNWNKGQSNGNIPSHSISLSFLSRSYHIQCHRTKHNNGTRGRKQNQKIKGERTIVKN